MPDNQQANQQKPDQQEPDQQEPDVLHLSSGLKETTAAG